MRKLITVSLSDIRESLHSKWFYIYLMIFGGAIAGLFATGITESQVMGFTGLNRLLITYTQLCMGVLPIFTLISIVRNITGDRENNVMEYILSMPLSLSNYYWGKLFGRYVITCLPIMAALGGSIIWGNIKGLTIPYNHIGYYALLIGALIWCFLSIGMFISFLVKGQELGIGIAFLLWLVLLLFIDAVLIGVMLQYRINEEIIISVSLLNPLQAFRTGAFLLFDGELSIMGPASRVVLDFAGRTGFLIYSILYPFVLGGLFSVSGYLLFKNKDIV